MGRRRNPWSMATVFLVGGIYNFKLGEIMAYRLGFLLCDHLLEHLSGEFDDYPEMFATAFAEVSSAIDWHVYDLLEGEVPYHVDECDGYLISGSRHGVYDSLPWIPLLEAVISDIARSDKPLVGLCFGHQILGQTLGGAVEKVPQGWGIGIHEYQVHVDQSWMYPRRAPFVIPACHQDQVVTLPAGAQRIASNDHCENFVIRYGERMLGIQGHPEFSREFISRLVEWRKDRMDEANYKCAQSSLERMHDNQIVKYWITTFLGIPSTLPLTGDR